MKSMDYNPAVITMLRHCYRCHPDILKQSNEIFYDNELVSSADELVAYNMVQCKHLLKKGFPVMFHGIEGKDSREGSSPSWFNADEATLVVSYVTKLLEDSNISVRGEEIGVIAPYQKQVQKIRQALSTGRSTKHGRGRPENPEFKKVQVGSCEQFQGKECRVIIISTVRSSPSFLKSDETFNLGFLNNPKRFNVAITRAKALLIIVGNPYVLQRDPCWKSMVDFCKANQSYTGLSNFPLRYPYFAPNDNNWKDVCGHSLGSLAQITTTQKNMISWRTSEVCQSGRPLRLKRSGETAKTPKTFSPILANHGLIK